MPIPPENLTAMQGHLHRLINRVAGHFFLMSDTEPDLPELSVLLSRPDRKSGMGVDGMFGGFIFWLEGDGVEARLVVQTSTRMGTGWNRSFVITPERCEEIDAED
jgi:hypothetical protein